MKKQLFIFAFAVCGLNVFSQTAFTVENFEANVFELTKAIMAKNYNRAFEVLNVLFLKRSDVTGHVTTALRLPW